MQQYGGDSLSGDFESRVVRGLVPGVTRVALLGSVFVASTATPPIDIASTPVALPTAAASLEVVSSSASDTAAGVGMQAVVIVGLDAAYASVAPMTVQLNGLTPVAVPTALFRINTVRGTMVTPGVGQQNNVGTITVRDAGGGTIRAIILPGVGLAQSSLFTVPAGFTLLIRAIELQIITSAGGTARGADAVLMIRSSTGFLTAARKIATTDVAPATIDANTYIPLLERTDFWIRCTYISNNNMTLNGSYEGLLFRN